nr:hypothetical protein [Aeromonas sp. FDAARGOS 1416]
MRLQILSAGDFAPSVAPPLHIAVPSTQYPDYLTLAITALDNPDAVAPTYHIHTESQLPWLPIQDEHPRYPKGK